jgi:hypothetical protein
VCVCGWEGGYVNILVNINGKYSDSTVSKPFKVIIASMKWPAKIIS